MHYKPTALTDATIEQLEERLRQKKQSRASRMQQNRGSGKSFSEATQFRQYDIRHRAAVEFLRDRETDAAHIYFADPPFNIGQKYPGFRDRVSDADHEDLMREVVKMQAARAAPSSAIIWHVPQEMLSLMLNIGEDNGLTLWKHVVRAFNFGQYTETSYVNGHESLLIFSKRKTGPRFYPRSVLVESVRRTMKCPDKRIKSAKWKGYRPPTTVWDIGRPQGNHGERWAKHPNQLPFRYLARIVLAHSTGSGKIVECFTGSGSLTAVSLAAGRQYIGCDLSLACCRSARDRVHNRQQMQLATEAVEDMRAPRKLTLPEGRDWDAV